MATESDRPIDLLDETRLNVASLLMEPVGNTRDLSIALASLPLDDELVAQDIRASARLTRLKGGILVDGHVAATVPLECVTCLDAFDQDVDETFSESFWQVVDVRTGAAIPPGDLEGDESDQYEPGFTIDESHELDVGEALRQWIVLAIPMQPSCGPNCPGPLIRSTSTDDVTDNRFATLASLLDDEPERET